MFSVASEGDTTRVALRGLSAIEVLAYLVCVAIAGVLGWQIRDAFNHDAVSYISLAQHYLNGRFDLAISGTWSPLFVWLLVPLVATFSDPAAAARVLSGLSAVVFLAGGISVLRTFAPPSSQFAGMFVIAIYGATRSADLITPDLLSAGIFGLFVSRAVRIGMSVVPTRCDDAVAGALIGLAYLAKSILFPIGLLAIGCVHLVRIIKRRATTTQTMRSLAFTVAALAIVAGPWIGALSIKYGHPVLSSAGKTVFVAIGPTDVNRDQPTNRSFVVPEPGRQSQFEDESILWQPIWSPFENAAYARHYLYHLATNASKIAVHLKSLDFFGIGVASGILGLAFLIKPSRQEEAWHWTGVFVVSCVALYLPVFADQERYFFVTYPVLLAAALAMTNQIFAGLGRSSLSWTTLLVTASFVLGACLTLPRFAKTTEYDYIKQSRLLAESIRAAGIPGPVATAAARRDSRMKHLAIYTSFFLNQPYHGTQDATTEAEVLESKARLIVVARFSSQDQLLTSSSVFLDLDNKLLGATEKVRMPEYRLFLNLEYGRN